MRATEQLRQSYRQTCWQSAPTEALDNLGRGRQASRGRRDRKNDRLKMRGKETEKRRREQENKSKVKVKRQEREQRSGSDQIRERAERAGGASHVGK